jgi:anti-anti-sigma regulatory factor
MTFRVGPGDVKNSLVVEGELDLATVERLIAAVDLCAIPDDELVIDCRRLTFIDGTGAQALMDVADKLPDGMLLILAGAHGFVLRVMDLLRLDTHPRVELRA